MRRHTGQVRTYSRSLVPVPERLETGEWLCSLHHNEAVDQSRLAGWRPHFVLYGLSRHGLLVAMAPVWRLNRLPASAGGLKPHSRGLVMADVPTVPLAKATICVGHPIT